MCACVCVCVCVCGLSVRSAAAAAPGRSDVFNEDEGKASKEPAVQPAEGGGGGGWGGRHRGVRAEAAASTRLYRMSPEKGKKRLGVHSRNGSKHSGHSMCHLTLSGMSKSDCHCVTQSV